MDGSPASVLEQPLARRSDAGQPEVDSCLTPVVRVMLHCLGEKNRPWHPTSEERHLFVERCRVKRTNATDHEVVAVKDELAECVQISLQFLVLFRIGARRDEWVCLTGRTRCKRILRGSKVQKLFGEAPAFLGWTEAELLGGYSLEIILRAGLGAFPFCSEGGNSIHFGGARYMVWGGDFIVAPASTRRRAVGK